MTPSCPTYGQALPDQPRRDPPLAPLEHVNVVTIHDLPEGERATAATEVRGLDSFSFGGDWRPAVRRLRTPRDVVDGREGGG